MKRNGLLRPLLALALLLTLCTSGALVAAHGEEAVALDFIWFSDGVEGQVMQSIIDDYKAVKPNVTINLIELPFADVGTKVNTMLSAGDPPALCRTTTVTAYRDSALDLTEALGGVETYASQLIDSYRENYIVDGRIIAVPQDITANGMLYNKTLFDKAGVKAPQNPEEVWTWDEYVAIVKQVQEKTGCAFGVVFDPWLHRFSTMLYEWDASLFTADRSACAVNSPQGVACLEFLVKNIKEGVFDESVWLGGENPNNLFRSGQSPAHIAGNWMLSNYKDISDFEWGVTFMPKQAKRSSLPGGKFTIGFKKNETSDKAATEFLVYLASKEVSDRFCRDNLFISPRKDSADLGWTEFGDELRIFANEVAVSGPETSNDWAFDLLGPTYMDFENNLKDAIMGAKTPKQAWDDAAEAVNAAIAAQ